MLSISALIGLAAMKSGLCLKQAEVHGMSQRGGEVHSHLRIADAPIASDLIPEGKADLILSVEPMEGLRYLPMLSEKAGWSPIPSLSSIFPIILTWDLILQEISRIPHHVAFNADEMAKETGSVRTMNTVMLGASIPFLNIPFEKFEDAITVFFESKGSEIIRMNLAALNKGRDFALKGLG